MYLSDLLSALNKNESIELSKPEIAAFFKKQEHITISQRIALFHKLGLRGFKTQQEAANSMGCPDSRPYVAQYDSMMDQLDGSLRSSIIDALCEGALDIRTVYNKLKKGYQPECVHQSRIRWKSSSTPIMRKQERA